MPVEFTVVSMILRLVFAKAESASCSLPYSTLCPSSAASSVFSEMVPWIDTIKKLILPICLVQY